MSLFIKIRKNCLVFLLMQGFDLSFKSFPRGGEALLVRYLMPPKCVVAEILLDLFSASKHEATTSIL